MFSMKTSLLRRTYVCGSKHKKTFQNYWQDGEVPNGEKHGVYDHPSPLDAEEEEANHRILELKGISMTT